MAISLLQISQISGWFLGVDTECHQSNVLYKHMWICIMKSARTGIFIQFSLTNLATCSQNVWHFNMRVLHFNVRTLGFANTQFGMRRVFLHGSDGYGRCYIGSIKKNNTNELYLYS